MATRIRVKFLPNGRAHIIDREKQRKALAAARAGTAEPAAAPRKK